MCYVVRTHELYRTLEIKDIPYHVSYGMIAHDLKKRNEPLTSLPATLALFPRLPCSPLALPF